VFLSAARFGLQFTGKPLNMQTLGSGVADPKGASDSDVLLKTDGDDDNVLSANDDSSARGTAVCDILDASDDEVILRADESTGDASWAAFRSTVESASLPLTCPMIEAWTSG
jgi:hypothetical protein